MTAENQRPGTYGCRRDASERIAEYIQANGPATRDDLVEALGIPRSSIYDHFAAAGIEPVDHEDRHVRGRPRVFFGFKEAEN